MEHHQDHIYHTRIPGPLELFRHTTKEFRSLFHKILPILAITFLVSVLQLILMFSATSATGVVLYGVGNVLGAILSLLSYIALTRIIFDHTLATQDLSLQYAQASKFFIPTL